MRRLLFSIVALALLSVPSSSFAATTQVNMTASAFSPKNLNLNYGDTVTWKNIGKTNHQIVANNGSFASGLLRPGQSFSFTFKAAGKYNYHDALKPSLVGSVSVKGLPPAVTLGVSAPIITYGQQTQLTGTVNNGQANEAVTVMTQPYGSSVQALATVMTGAGGSFAFTIQPTIYTTYNVSWKGANSQTVTVQVRPKLTLVRSGSRLVERTSGTASYAGHHVYLQKHSQFGQWVTVGKLKLGPLGGKILKVPHRIGTTVYRVYMTTNQAGLGYLESWSNTVRVTYKR